MFCEKCGSILSPSQGKLVCSSCGNEVLSEFRLEAKTKAKNKLLEEAKHDVNPIVSAKCRKCGNKNAYFAIKQTRASDEAATKFFRCTECG